MTTRTPKHPTIALRGAAAAGLAAFLLAGCGGSSSSASTSTAAPSTNAPGTSGASATAGAEQSASVPIKDFKFAPATVKVKVGGTVKFTNEDRAAHTATSDQAGAFDTNALQNGATKTVTFAKAGTFAYHCDFHPFMKGTVVVVK